MLKVQWKKRKQTGLERVENMSYHDSRYTPSPIYKKYVDVLEIRHKDGTLEPKAILFDGKAYKIDKVEFNHQYASSRAGGGGKYYAIYMNGRKRSLFLEKDKWFIETIKRPPGTVDNVLGDNQSLTKEELEEIDL